MKYSRRQRFCTLALLLLALPACQTRMCQCPAEPLPIDVVVQPNSLPNASRVVIYPLENLTNVRGVEAKIQQILAQQLRRAGNFEFVELKSHDVPACDIKAISRGQYPLSTLVDLYHQFNADAVMFGAVHEYRPYAPLSVGLTLHLVDTREAVTVATLAGNWSLSSEKIVKAFHQHLAQFPEVDRQALLHSPTAFVEFVATQMAARLSEEPPAAPSHHEP